MAENNENKIRRRKVSSTNLKNTNNNRNTIKNSNNTKNKSKNSRNNKKESSVQDIKRKQEEKEQFELEREIYYRKKKIKRKKRLKLITRLASLCLILLVIGGICFSAFAISAIQGAPKVTKELIRENYISDTSVVVVLVGKNTYCRKHVDWEISAGLLNNAGLIGLALPSHSS